MLKKIIFLSVLFIQVALASDYNISVRGHEAGHAKIQADITDKAYQINVAAYPNSLANFFGIKPFNEAALGTIQNGHFYPKEFTRKNKKKKVDIKIDFKAKTTTTSEGIVEFTGTYSPLVQDYLTQIFQIGIDLKQNHLKSQYYLVTDHKIRAYHASRDGFSVTLKQTDGKRMIEIKYNESYQLQELQNSKGKTKLLSLKKIK